MSAQMPLNFDSAQTVGVSMAEACADRAESMATLFREPARAFVLAYLREHGDAWSEQIVDAAVAAGIDAPDHRAFGAVFGALSRRDQIRAVEYGRRLKGHGTAGAIKWTLTA